MKAKKPLRYAALLFACAAVGLGIFAWVQKSREPQLDTISRADALVEYDAMWQMIEENYPLIPAAERKFSFSADAIKAEYREKIQSHQGKSIPFVEYEQILNECLDWFGGIGHLKICPQAIYQNSMNSLAPGSQSPSAENRLGRWQYENILSLPLVKQRYAYLAAAQENGAQQTPQKPVENLEFSEPTDTIAYVKIKSFQEKYIKEDSVRLQEWFASNAEKDYIIIDITGNTGGTDQYWSESIVQPNIDAEIGYSFSYLTNYGKETQVQMEILGVGLQDLSQNFDELLQLPSISKEDVAQAKYMGTYHWSRPPSLPNKLCKGRFFLLVDGEVYSAAEDFAYFCKATGFATLVGQNTRGDVGLGRCLMKLPKSGLLVRYFGVNTLNPDGSSNMEFGTVPDIIAPDRFPNTNDRPTPLTFCLKYIQELQQ